jgi:23S rRNA (uracil1939-C5)-methyltransferase
VSASPRQWRYRRKLTLAFRRANDGWIAGLRRYDAPDEVFQLVDCPITDESVITVWKAVLANQHLLPRARELRGAVRALADGFSFTLEGGQRWPGSARFLHAIPSLAELWWIPDGGSRRLVQSRGTSQAGASFVQVNPHVSDQLRAWVMTLASALRPGTAVDAYAGTGDIAVALAQDGVRVVAIERDAESARIAGSRLPQGSSAVASAVETALPAALPAELVVLNPPRAGIDGRVAELLNAQRDKPKAIVYVSCNPATLARDVRRLSGYRIRSLRGFDMFPQTAHVETVCELVPAA